MIFLHHTKQRITFDYLPQTDLTSTNPKNYLQSTLEILFGMFQSIEIKKENVRIWT